MCVSSTSAPCALASKLETYLEKEKFMLHHSTAVIFRVILAPSSFEKKASKNPRVSRVANMKKVGRCNFKQLFRALIVGLLLMVRLMTILCAFLVAPSCISATISDENSASSCRSLSTGDDGPWGSSPEGEAVSDLLPRGVLKGGVYGARVKVTVLLFYSCFKLGVFSLVVKRSSRAI